MKPFPSFAALRRPGFFLPSLLAVTLFTGPGLIWAADAPVAGDERLRATLRDTMMQLRTAQDGLATAQAAQAAAADEAKVLAEKYEALKKQSASDHAAADRTSTVQAAQLAEQKSLVVRLTAELEKTRADREKMTQAARGAQEQGTKLASENILLQRQLAERESKNLALFVLANEILGRYEDYSLGRALSAKEPFVGLTRTKLENLVQDYQDKLLDQRIRQ